MRIQLFLLNFAEVFRDYALWQMMFRNFGNNCTQLSYRFVKLSEICPTIIHTCEKNCAEIFLSKCENSIEQCYRLRVSKIVPRKRLESTVGLNSQNSTLLKFK